MGVRGFWPLVSKRGSQYPKYPNFKRPISRYPNFKGPISQYPSLEPTCSSYLCVYILFQTPSGQYPNIQNLSLVSQYPYFCEPISQIQA